MQEIHSPLWTIFFVLQIISALFVYGDSTCPLKCDCNAKNVKCLEKQLTDVPDFTKLFTAPIGIDLSSNTVKVTSSSFNNGNLNLVEILLLKDNSITHLDENVFWPLHNLKNLDLSGNLLEDVPSKIIEANDNMEYLCLAGNILSTKTPKLLSLSLKVLDLSFAKISTFSEDNLDGLPNLEVLYLQANNIKRIDYKVFLNVDLKLTHINLAHNSWLCHCDTIKLFDTLALKNITLVDKLIQCMYSNKLYEDIYTEDGSVGAKKLCGKISPESVTAATLITSEFAPKLTETPLIHAEQGFEGENAFHKLDEMFINNTALFASCMILVALVIGICVGILLTTAFRKEREERLYAQIANNNHHF